MWTFQYTQCYPAPHYVSSYWNRLNTLKPQVLSETDISGTYPKMEFVNSHYLLFCPICTDFFSFLGSLIWKVLIGKCPLPSTSTPLLLATLVTTIYNVGILLLNNWEERGFNFWLGVHFSHISLPRKSIYSRMWKRQIASCFLANIWLHALRILHIKLLAF